jgi:hypothetical protein
MPSFSLDDGENAAVTFAGNLDAVFFLCDKLIQLGLIHVLFGNTRLVTRHDVSTPFDDRSN